MKKLLLPFAVFAAFTAPAIAAPAWDYVEAGYVKTDIDNLRNVDVDGFEVSGKKRISSNYFVEGKVFDLSGDSSFDADVQGVSLGLGYVRDISRDTDVYSTLSLEHIDLDGGFKNAASIDSDFGFGMGLGVRSMVEADTEVGAKINYVHVRGYEEVTLRGDIYHYLNPEFALGAQYEVGGDADVMRFMVRYSF
tara:strand:- start:81 stop:659 length:579 start_codon:yes stop_codon:yes gene_type:complete